MENELMELLSMLFGLAAIGTLGAPFIVQSYAYDDDKKMYSELSSSTKASLVEPKLHDYLKRGVRFFTLLGKKDERVIDSVNNYRQSRKYLEAYAKDVGVKIDETKEGHYVVKPVYCDPNDTQRQVYIKGGRSGFNVIERKEFGVRVYGVFRSFSVDTYNKRIINTAKTKDEAKEKSKEAAIGVGKDVAYKQDLKKMTFKDLEKRVTEIYL